MNFPLIRCNAKNFLKIPIKCRHRLKPALLRYKFHTVRMFLHMFTCHLHTHKIEVIWRSHIHGFLKHPSEMCLRHMADSRKISNRQIFCIMLSDIMQCNRHLRHPAALLSDLVRLFMVHPYNIHEKRQYHSTHALRIELLFIPHFFHNIANHSPRLRIFGWFHRPCPIIDNRY